MLYQLSYFRNYVYIKNLQTNRDSIIKNKLSKPVCILLFQHMWAKMDSNHRSRKTADLQSAPFGHSGICPNFCHYFRKRICDSFTHSRHLINVGASCRIRTNDPEITNHVLWPTELKRQRQFVRRYCRKASANVRLFF